MSARKRVSLAACLLVALVSAGSATRAQSRRESGNDPPSAASFDAIRSRAEEARTAGRLQDAIELYRRGVGLHPAWVEGHWYLGTINYELEKYPACRNEFREVVRLQKENGAAWAFKGLCEFQLKNYRIALNNLNKGSALGMKEPELIPVAHYHRAILLTRFQQYERALQAFGGLAREGNTSPQMIEGTGIAVLHLPF